VACFAKVGGHGILLAMTFVARSSRKRILTNAPLIDAITPGVQEQRRAVWFMRQAGRSLPEYRQVRAGIDMLDSCFMPELLAEITLQPVRRHDVDACGAAEGCWCGRRDCVRPWSGGGTANS